MHCLGYQSIVQRLCSTATMTALKPTQKSDDPNAQDPGDLGPDFDLGMYNVSQIEEA